MVPSVAPEEKDIERAKYWKERGYDFDPNLMSRYTMDQKVRELGEEGGGDRSRLPNVGKSSGRKLSTVSHDAYYSSRYSQHDVYLLKSCLASLRYKIDPLTNGWDSQAGDAVRSFQKENNLVSDGKIGPNTLRVMADSIRLMGGVEEQLKNLLSSYLLSLSERRPLVDNSTSDQIETVNWARPR